VLNVLGKGPTMKQSTEGRADDRYDATEGNPEYGALSLETFLTKSGRNGRGVKWGKGGGFGSRLSLSLPTPSSVSMRRTRLAGVSMCLEC
jgi:hypothetical protein